MPKVSVIIPTFNCEQYIEESILSVTCQTEGDLELIVVDDGSTDGTLAILSRLAAVDNRIRLYSGPHTGYPGAPRNRGLALAQGEYISFLDGDDLYHPEKFSRALATLEALPEAGFVFHDFVVFENNPAEGTSYLKKIGFLHGANKHLTEAGSKTYMCGSGLYSFTSVLEFVPFHTSSVTLRRHLLDSGTLFLREDIRVGDDADFWFRLAMRCRAAFVDEVLSFYRKRPGSISSDPVEYLLGSIQIHTENLERGKGMFEGEDERLYRAKIAGRFFDLGYEYFRRGNRREARIAYSKSIHTDFTVRSLAAYLKTFTPETFLRIRRTGSHFRPSAVAHPIDSKQTGDGIHEDSYKAGQNDVRLARKNPELRRFLGSTSYSEDGYLKMKARKLAGQMPVPFECLAGTARWLAEQLPEVRPLRHIGARMLLARRSVARLRGAVAEAGGWKEFESEFSVAVPVLLYHNVGPLRPGTNPRMTISAETFEGQIRWLRRHGYTGIRPSDWLAWCREGKRLPEKPVMITFDDAFADFTKYVLPILDRYGFTSAIFVVQDWVGGRNRWYDKKYTVTLPCMTGEQIRQCAAAGVEFGAHTRTHPDLRTLTDDAIASEMQGSAQYLSSLLNRPVTSFAYPYGVYSKSAKETAAHIFDLAFSCEEGFNGICTDPYLLRRKVLLPDDTLGDLALYMKFGWSRRSLGKRWRAQRARLLGAGQANPANRPNCKVYAGDAHTVLRKEEHSQKELTVSNSKVPRT
ncbi:MAG TPA: glycosyltransferase [Patescibacteria group bacterium]|nr:glycosyltransferase [Patescibacteria group bacterium]